MEKNLVKDPFGKRIISGIYDLLRDSSLDSSDSKLKAWEGDLQEEIPNEEWIAACKNAQSQTANTRLKLQYNWLMRIYITPEKLHLFNPSIPDHCTTCEIREHFFIVYGSAPK